LAVIPAQTFAIFIWEQVLMTALIYALGFLILLAVLKPFTETQAKVLQSIHPQLPIWISWLVRG
jgi:hypothetical protein